MTVTALDVGGANLKAADGLGYAASRAFELWRAPERLATELALMLEAAPRCTIVAATLTGELADCFATKDEGVLAIVDALQRAAGNRELWIYFTDGRIVSADDARTSPHLAAASNWHALATFSATHLEVLPSLLLDLGSTTADIIPLTPSGPAARGTDDTTRLLYSELVYTGVGRTPICSVLSHLPWQGRNCPVAAEFFATTSDAYVVLGELPESGSCDTADSRPQTREYSRSRLARMICADATSFTMDDAIAAAKAVREAQVDRLLAAAKSVIGDMPHAPRSLVLSGQGEFILRDVASRLSPQYTVTSFADLYGSYLSQCAPAHALASLVRSGKEEAVLQ